MRLSRLLLSSVLVLCPLAAHADTILLFQFSGLDVGSFELSSQPTVTITPTPGSVYGVFTDGFSVDPIAGTVTGTLFSSVTFYDSIDFGGFTDTDPNEDGYAGPTVFTGTTATPTFHANLPIGFYLYSDPGTVSAATGSIVETLTISAVPSPAPEPSSLALFGTGILGLAGAVRRRLRK